MSESVELTKPDAAFAPWDPKHLSTLLTDQAFATVDGIIQQGFNAREPSVVEWCYVAGYQQGNVVALYHLTHNSLRFSRGRVPLLADLRAAATYACLLLLRVAQDVVTCKTYLARTDRDGIYRAFAGMVTHWLTRWRVGVLPTPAETADALFTWIEARGSNMPSPAWATCFELPLWGWSWDWSCTTAENKLSLEQIKDLVPNTRKTVADEFVTQLRSAVDWSSFLSLDFSKK